MELREHEHGSSVDRVLLVRGADLRTKRGGDDVFLRLELADRSGAVTAMVWEDAAEVAAVAVRGSAVRVVGRFEVHERFGRQIQLDRVEAVDQDAVDLSLLIEGPSQPVAELERRFRALITRTEDPWLRALLERVFDPAGAFWPRFRIAPAAKHFHEAYPHGLLDHTLRVAEAVEGLAPLFPPVDRDVAVAGAILHDIGKAQTYTPDPVAPDLTDVGRLEGHIVIGYEIVRRVVGAIEGFPPETARSIRHIVLSHHGKVEYGSPVVPATREAVLVHQADDLAARMGSLDRLERGLKPGDEWSGYDRALEGAAFFGPARGGAAPPADEHAAPASDPGEAPAPDAGGAPSSADAPPPDVREEPGAGPPPPAAEVVDGVPGAGQTSLAGLGSAAPTGLGLHAA
ncbi:3'-5' exoribonuclease YhaM family protein [Patulibacter sp.]|uniref:3'-5' exoribonuclease YhaM family protein n=1 Tax=Patulibacter sp. TaxID=1912859 RepID=UPI002720A5F7|nr:HD domain-containing protein [Patulibacter sp.]MDO9407123.1 HD domain-containing protein [Patulibacter sp.]